MENRIDFTFNKAVVVDEGDSEWIQQTQSVVQLRDYGFDGVDREEEFFAIREELFNIFLER
ncbi:hypothetical protein NXZ77_10350 [Lysinibacillus boronitolerans]|uniref:hypothetical protein n=1 Tax=Lysinibacillus boronitolerans TaxID=309788 RepID=UPI0021634A22|nr:hypothetical protein [Lysinibacillus boronitolerans]MCS1391973.1 hypothetical protein [Lysinibacillus boronitolerans]